FHHDAAGANALQKLFRRQQAAQRDWNRARAELRELQAERAELKAELELAEVDQGLPRQDAAPTRPTSREVPLPSVPSTPANAVKNGFVLNRSPGDYEQAIMSKNPWRQPCGA